MCTKSIYIHIPFCASKCLYCDFTSYSGKESLYREYVEALKAEIRLWAGRFPETRISTIFFGGGTPNVLSPAQLADILHEIKLHFLLEADAEITTEANPGVLLRDNTSLSSVCDILPSDDVADMEDDRPSPFGEGGRVLRREGVTVLYPFGELKSSGFNRLSLGVQSLHDDELRLLGRIHTAVDAVRSLEAARAGGFENISLDLMYGIPGQTLHSWQETLAQVITLAPEHVSLYSLTIEEGTPFCAMKDVGKLELPGDDTEADMYEEAIRTLTAAGYIHYEISNFARPGFECRHNITYWRNEPYFGFGVGAVSYLGGVRATNTSDVNLYIGRISVGELPVESEERPTERQSMGETMFLGLRMMRGVDARAFMDRYGKSPDEVFGVELARLKSRGLIESEDGFICLTGEGLMLANEVSAEFV